MTQKDTIKILLCSYGYDRNIKITPFRTDYGTIGYEIYAENKEGDIFDEVCGEGFMFIVYQILKHMKKEKAEFESNWWNTPTKYVLDDEEREKIINQFDERDKKIAEDREKLKPLKKWQEENNPCPKCTINKKDHWDFVHYNCELNHTNRCEIVKKYYEERMIYMQNLLKN